MSTGLLLDSFADRLGDGMARFDPDYVAARKVLESPEMRAIRKLLINCVENNVVGYWDFGGEQKAVFWLENHGMPKSVIDWLTEDEK